jgi:hypothetical protein
MHNERPIRTAELAEVLAAAAHAPGLAIILERVLARVTHTSVTYWVQLRSRRIGPKPLFGLGECWYDVREVDAWLSSLVDPHSGEKSSG